MKDQIEKRNNSCYYIRDHGPQKNVSSSSLWDPFKQKETLEEYRYFGRPSPS